MSRPAHVVVVGGGITGLAAAHRLSTREDGPQVTLLEAAPRPGGAIRTSDFAGGPLDEAADGFLARVPWATDLCHELGLGDELVSPAARTARVFSRGALRPFPTSHVLGVPLDPDDLAATGIVGEAGVAEHRAAVDAAGPEPTHDVPLREALCRQVGVEVTDRLVGPLVGGINAGDPAHISLDAVTPQLADAARHPDGLVAGLRALRASHPPDPDAPVFHSLPGGMGRLVGALVDALRAAGLALRPGTPVAAVAETAAGLRVTTATGETIDADGVVLAAGASTTARVLEGLDAEAAEALATVDHASVALVSLAVDPRQVEVELDATGYVVPRVEGLELTACSWASSKWGHLGGRDHALLRASVGSHGSAEVLDLPDERLVEVVLGDLGATMGLSGRPAEVRVSRWPRSLPQYAPGHLDLVDGVDRALARHDVPLAATGAAFRGLGIPACIRQGREAADLVAGRLAG